MSRSVSPDPRPFRLQENRGGGYDYWDYWVDIPGSYQTLVEAELALDALQAGRCLSRDLRVHFTPEDASAAILEAQHALRMVNGSLDMGHGAGTKLGTEWGTRSSTGCTGAPVAPPPVTTLWRCGTADGNPTRTITCFS